MSIVIEKGIPAPVKPGVRQALLPLEQMEVGDSLVVGLDGRASWAFAFKQIQDAQKIHKIRLTSRLIEPGKRRIWRVA